MRISTRWKGFKIEIVVIDFPWWHSYGSISHSQIVIFVVKYIFQLYCD